MSAVDNRFTEALSLATRTNLLYFREHEAIGAARPANAIPVDLHEFFAGKKARVPTGMESPFSGSMSRR